MQSKLVLHRVKHNFPSLFQFCPSFIFFFYHSFPILSYFFLFCRGECHCKHPSEPPYTVLSFFLPSSVLFLLFFSFLPSSPLMMASWAWWQWILETSFSNATSIVTSMRLRPNTLICNLFSILCSDLCGGGRSVYRNGSLASQTDLNRSE